MTLRNIYKTAGFTLTEFIISTIILTIILSGSTSFFINYINNQIRSIGYLGSMEENLIEISMLGNMIKHAKNVQVIYPFDQASDEAPFHHVILEKPVSEANESPYSVISTTEIVDTSANNQTIRVAAIKDIFLFNDTHFDQASNTLYYTNTGNHTIRALNVVNGDNTLVAGIPGESGFNEFTGPLDAKAANLNAPAGVTVANGIIYISDTGNNRIRKIENDLIETIAGNGEAGYREEPGQTATEIPLHNPMGIAVDSEGNIIFADTKNHRIRMIRQGIIETIAGKGYPEQYVGATNEPIGPMDTYFHYPLDITLDGEENIYVSDSHFSRIVKVQKFNNEYVSIRTISGGLERKYRGDDGPAMYATLNVPSGLHYQNGNLYVSDSLNHIIRVIEGGENGIPGDEEDRIRTLVGYTNRMLIHSGNDKWNKEDDIYVNAHQPNAGFLQGSNESEAPASSAMVQLNNPTGITLDATGNVFFIDALNNQIRAYIGSEGPSPIQPYHQVTVEQGNIYTLVKNPTPQDITGSSEILFSSINLDELTYNEVNDYIGNTELSRFRFEHVQNVQHPYLVLDIESAYSDQREISSVQSRMQTTVSLRNYRQ